MTRLYLVTVLMVISLTYCYIYDQGANFEIFGPVVPELIMQTHTDYESMLKAVSMRGAGHFFGGILGKRLYLSFRTVSFQPTTMLNPTQVLVCC